MQNPDQNHKIAFSPKLTHINNGSSSARKSRSRQLVSATTIVQKCIRILSLLSNDSTKEQPYMHLKEESDPLFSIGQFIDQIYDSVSKLIRKDSEGYDQIESLLQKQQNLNRSLIKKQLQFREQHKTLYDELSDEKKKINKLNEHISKLNEQIKEKDLTIMHLKNQLRACQKERLVHDDSDKRLIDRDLASFKEQLPRELTISKQLPRETGYLSKETEKTKVHKLGHRRRNSDDILRKPSKGQHKKKSIITKK